MNASYYTKDQGLQSPDDLIHFSGGGVYRLLAFPENDTVNWRWTILTNHGGACGWYRTDNPNIQSQEVAETVIKMTDGSTHPLFPGSSRIFHVDDISFSAFTPDAVQDKYPPNWVGDDITLYIKSDATLMGVCNPLLWWVSAVKPDVWSMPKHGTLPDLSDDDWYHYDGSSPLRDLQSMDIGGDHELRRDPFDDVFYSKFDFTEYYGDTYLWDMMAPWKVATVLVLETILERNKGSLNTKNKDSIVDKMFECYTGW